MGAVVSRSDFKVGLFVLLGLVLVGLVIFLIGDERRVFARSVTFRAEFDDVQGLKNGAPVSMGGVRIGHVQSVRYSDDPVDTTVYVELSIVRGEAGRIQSDSVASIANKGFLGDKMVSITKGNQPPPIEPGGLIPSEDPPDMLGVVNRIARKAETAIEGFDGVTRAFSDDELHRDLRALTKSMNVVLKHVAEGEGYPNRFLTDPREAERISRTLDNLDKSSAELNGLLSELRLSVRRVRTGPGFAHDVIYGEGPKKEMAQLGTAAEEVATTLREIRQSESFAHDVLFGGPSDGSDALSDVRQITADVRDIVRGVKQGKGTIGALLVDPSVYEDMKRVLGNVERNDVLRALVRYSIKQDEKAPQVTVDGKR
ncbi:MAG: MCE family protein [Deltaproteobacteria bacterium]|jgi:phospholipid/cholesterol/gamma-HCH transport system substrate-binding protein|nr:MCE family protein [Deltaproteobacteria bacterium]MBW2530628.1 MCE family protein [Deltaproteobacteria bacterium]